MGFFDLVKEQIRSHLRAFVLGDAAVSVSTSTYGVDNSTFSPDEYGNYIAISNGVFTCATGRAKLLSQLKRKAYKLNKDGTKDEVTTGNFVSLMKKVNPYWTWSRMIRMTELSMCLWGECFWFLNRGNTGMGTPTEMFWGKPSRVKVYPDPDKYINKYSYEHEGKEIFFDPSEVIWFRFPNPIDEFSGLSPLAASRMAADYSNEAWRSNAFLFKNGSQMGGIISPKSTNRFLTPEAAREIENQVEKRTQGVDKAHRWNIFRFEVETKEMGVTPKDAEFLGGLKLALEEICRAYDWPLDLAGGQRTYENFAAALLAAWTMAVLPEADFLAEEITEQLVPMFRGEVDLFELDSSHIKELQKNENEEWTRAQGQIQAGALLINEYREQKGKDPVPWGDVWWPAPGMPVKDDQPVSLGGFGGFDDFEYDEDLIDEEDPTDEEPVDEGDSNKEDGEDERATSLQLPPYKGGERAADGLEWDSEEHQRAWKRFVDFVDPWEKRVDEVVVELLNRQQESVLAILGKERALNSGSSPAPLDKLGDRGEGGSLLERIFNFKRWLKEFRVKMRPVIRDLVADRGKAEFENLGIEISFDVKRPEVKRFIEQRVQRFAQDVNETTWKRLQSSLAEGIDKGEGIDKLSERVEDVMGKRIKSSPETIARTEVIGASNGGTLEAWKQSGVVTKKGWLGSLDGRERPSHKAAHLRYQSEPIGIDDDFEVGSGRGPAPGQIGLAEEDVNCRCTMVPEID